MKGLLPLKHFKRCLVQRTGPGIRPCIRLCSCPSAQGPWPSALGRSDLPEPLQPVKYCHSSRSSTHPCLRRLSLVRCRNGACKLRSAYVPESSQLPAAWITTVLLTVALVPQASGRGPAGASCLLRITGAPKGIEQQAKTQCVLCTKCRPILKLAQPLRKRQCGFGTSSLEPVACKLLTASQSSVPVSL